MSIGNWFKKLFSSPADTETSEEFAAEANEIDINEARIDAGGSGPVGFPGEPDTHATPGEYVSDE